MTKEREAQIRASVARIKAQALSGAWMSEGYHDQEALLAEIDRLRALPVLRTCGECAHCVTDLHVGEWCDRDEHQRDTEKESPPPSWCPLGGPR